MNFVCLKDINWCLYLNLKRQRVAFFHAIAYIYSALGIIALIIAMTLHLVASVNHTTPQVLGAHRQSIAPENKPLPANKTVTETSATEVEHLIPRNSESEAKSTSLPVNQSTSLPPWGQTEKIGDHLYRTHVGSDTQMATSDDIFNALNVYRTNHGIQSVGKDDKLCAFAQKRAQDQNLAGGLDTHKGFNDYMADSNHWDELNVHGIGENSAWNYQLTGTHLIEWVFDADQEHRDNQLNPAWTLACAGVSGKTVDVIFGRR